MNDPSQHDRASRIRDASRSQDVESKFRAQLAQSRTMGAEYEGKDAKGQIERAQAGWGDMQLPEKMVGETTRQAVSKHGTRLHRGRHHYNKSTSIEWQSGSVEARR